MALRDYISRVQPDRIFNDAPWVTVEPAARPSDGAYYEAALIHHLTPDENGGNHNLFVDIIDINGRLLDPGPLSAKKLGWTWAGRDIFGQPAPPYAFDKQPPSPAADLPLFANMDTSAWITDAGAGPVSADASHSDRVVGLRLSGYPPLDGEGNNRPGHNSYYIIFRRLNSQRPTGPVLPDPPVIVTPPANGDVLAQLEQLRADMAQLATRVQILEDKDGVKG